MTFYYPICPKCGKQMICIEERKREKKQPLKGWEYTERYEEFVCGDCGITKEYTDARVTKEDDITTDEDD